MMVHSSGIHALANGESVENDPVHCDLTIDVSSKNVASDRDSKPLECTDDMMHPKDPNLNSKSESEPIAIIGLGCRLPGSVSSDTELWDLLRAGRSGQCEVPPSRYNIDAFHDSDGNQPDSLSMRGGYFLTEDPRQFENSFFGISNLEATYMDPQQRKLLEVCFECFESAGIRLEDIAGSNTGCFVGNFTIDFQTMQMRDPGYIHRYSATGGGSAILSNRITHVFDLRGPSMTLDTACSSSLYGLHYACKALESGECDAAIVAGANLIQSVDQQISTACAGVLSPTSACHVFSDTADGYARAEAVGALYLKRLKDAVSDNDNVRSIVRGTAVNGNGRTSGITLPASSGQEAVIVKAYQSAGLDFAGTDYVECHGTGTPVGDPIEVRGIANMLSKSSRSSVRSEPLLIGSVKSNLGHSEGASGITSIIKATLALEHQQIPGTINVDKLNTKIPWNDYDLQVVQSLRPWPRQPDGNRPLRASVNSFGYGGSNAHCILERPAQREPDRLPSLSQNAGDCFILPLSAASEKSLHARISDIRNLEIDESRVRDLAYTLGQRRTHFPWRGFVVVRQGAIREDVKRRMSCRQSSKSSDAEVPFTFVFSGQGAQWPCMGKELLENNIIFRDSIKAQENHLSILNPPPRWSLTEQISNPSSEMDNPVISQPVCTAIQIALVDLLRVWHITPTFVIGHSSGEIAAAYAAGHISCFFAITTAYFRGQAVSDSHSNGAMMAVGIGRDKAKEFIERNGFTEKVCIACQNSPENVTLSGDVDAINILHCQAQEKKIFARILKTGGRAYHSHHMMHIGQKYEEMLRITKNIDDQSNHKYIVSGTTWTKDYAIMVSSVSGHRISADVTACPSYWRKNLESAVLFQPAIEAILEIATCQFVEIGPHAALEMPVSQIKASISTVKDPLPYLSVLYRKCDSERSSMDFIGRLWSSGFSIDFERINNPKNLHTQSRRVMTNLPRYKWNYTQLLWNESRSSNEFRHRKHLSDELLGSLIPGMSGQISTWRNRLDLTRVTWLQDHRLAQDIVFPAAGYISMVSKAAQQLHDLTSQEYVLEIINLKILKALVLSLDQTVEMFTELAIDDGIDSSEHDPYWKFSISTFDQGQSTERATGMVGFRPQSLTRAPLSRPVDLHVERQVSRNWYSRFNQISMNYGPAFQSLSELQNDRMRISNGTLASLAPLPDTAKTTIKRYIYDVHPITIDAQLQALIIATTNGSLEKLQAKVPVRVGVIQMLPTRDTEDLTQCEIFARAELAASGVMLASSDFTDMLGQQNLLIRNFRALPFQGSWNRETVRHPMSRVIWKPDISRLCTDNIDALTTYIDRRINQKTSKFPADFREVVEVLKLFAHRQPDFSILEIGCCFDTSRAAVMSELGEGTSFQLFTSYTRATMKNDTAPQPCQFASIDPTIVDEHCTEFQERQFDFILYTQSEPKFDNTVAEFLLKVLSPKGTLLVLGETLFRSFTVPDIQVHTLYSASLSNPITLLSAQQEASSSETLFQEALKENPHLQIVAKEIDHPLNVLLQKRLETKFELEVPIITMDQLLEVDLQPKATIIVTVEMTQPLLCGISPQHHRLVQKIVHNASRILWITGGKLIHSEDPEFSLAFGLARSVMSEEPSLKFAVLGLGDTPTSFETMVSNVESILYTTALEGSDLEFLEKDGLLYISRFVPDGVANEEFCMKKDARASSQHIEGSKRYELSIGEYGKLDSLRYHQIPFRSDIPPDYLEIDVKSFSLNAKDLYTIMGKIETAKNTYSCEYAGVVTRVGSEVVDLALGDRVVSLAPGRFATFEYAPSKACYKIRDHEQFTTISTVPVVFATAIHALRNIACLKRSESVLIHSAAGGVGIAAIHVAMDIGAEIFASVGTDKKKDFLIDTFGLDPGHIFNSRDTNFLHGVMKCTGNRGVDVVLNSLTGESLHRSIEACAEFGRFVEIGKHDILNSSKLNMRVFLRNLTFSAFDLHDIYYSDDPRCINQLKQLLADAMALYRKVKTPDPIVFDISEVGAAFKSLANRTRLGKIALSYESGQSSVPIVVRKFVTKFMPDKSYLLVGCLGGLGRSIARYLWENGARHFIFLSRSGVTRHTASCLVSDLRRSGASVNVIHGDVQDFAAVQKAVTNLTHPLGGVVQAAMGLNESLYGTMTSHQWHAGLGPKVRGSWNLHTAIAEIDRSLDFFLMTSSLSGSVGSATESNYCAANCFLDHFASYRRARGLPATSIGLGQVGEIGYLHEHPEIERMLARRGLSAISEDDMLQIIDIALSRPQKLRHADSGAADAHFLTGLEPQGMETIWSQGYEGSQIRSRTDPRLSILALATPKLEHTKGAIIGKSGLPEAVVAAVASQDRSVLHDACSDILAKKLSNLVLMSIDDVSPDLRLGNVGMDSMLASEYRTSIFETFNVDVPFLTLMARETSLSDITGRLCQGLLDSK